MGNVTGIVFRRLEANKDQELTVASKVLVAGDSATDQNCATDALVYTLPAITADNLGIEIVFRNTGADGAAILTVSPNAIDAIHGTVANAAADSVSAGALNKDFINTKATANKGDYVRLTAVALTEWYISGGVGIWASEA